MYTYIYININIIIIIIITIIIIIPIYGECIGRCSKNPPRLGEICLQLHGAAGADLLVAQHLTSGREENAKKKEWNFLGDLIFWVI